MEDDGAGLRGENRKSNQGGAACWVWEQNSQSRGTVLGKKTEEEVAVKGKNHGQSEGLCCWLEKNGGGLAAWRR